ncbi:MAG TPA: tetratricopeptide repeat protein, partial [Bryobacteraceae bacterium]|nr:tetratricopeptide repeat protein [Bryobacteraceae bacterium]
MSRLLFHLALLLATAAVALAEPGVLTARRLAREGLAAHAAGNEREYLAKLTAAVAAAPDYPRLLVNLAEAQVANGQMEEAVATLGKLADLGTHSPVADNANLAALRGRDDFKAVVKRI